MASLLVISEESETEDFAKGVASCAGLELICKKNHLEGISVIDSESPVAIFVEMSSQESYDSFENAVKSKLGLFTNKIDSNGIHFICPKSLEATPYIAKSTLFGHFLNTNLKNQTDCASLYGRVLGEILKPQFLGLAGFFKSGTQVQTLKLHSTVQKQNAIEAIKNYVIAAKFQKRITALIANAVDELLMNAMFDAPVDTLGKQLYAATPRNTAFSLDGNQVVELQVGYDGTYLGITAIDQYGSLSKQKLISHLSKLYNEDDYKIKTSLAGAGIGLATIYQCGGSLFFSCEAQVRTAVTVFFKKMNSFREFRDQFQFICTRFIE